MEDYIRRGAIKYEQWNVGPLCEPLMVARKSVIDNLPAADVAPVVRCENCCYATWAAWANKYSCGQVHGLLAFGDHFCAFGKRERTEGE